MEINLQLVPELKQAEAQDPAAITRMSAPGLKKLDSLIASGVCSSSRRPHTIMMPLHKRRRSSYTITLPNAS